MSVERLLPQMLMSIAAILVGILLVLMGLLRIGRSIKFHHHHRISLQRCRDHRQRPAGGILPPIRLGPVANICITEGLPGRGGEPRRRGKVGGADRTYREARGQAVPVPDSAEAGAAAWT